MERWLDVEGYEEYYEVSDLGRIRNKKKNKLVNPYSDSRGYLSVDLGYVGKKRVRMHQLIMRTFKPEDYFEKAEVDHIDGNKHNNVLTNLEYVTHAENLRRWAIRVGEVIVAVSPEGEKFEYALQADIYKEHPQLDFRHISACLKGKLKHHKQWKFHYKKDEEAAG